MSEEKQYIAHNAVVTLRLSRTVQVQSYEPFSMQLQISSDGGEGSYTKEGLDDMVNDLSDYMMVKFEEEFQRQLDHVRGVSK